MKNANQSMQRNKKIVSAAACSLLLSASALAQPTTFGAGAGTGGNSTNSYYGVSSGANNSTGDLNTFVGYTSGLFNTSGHSNTCIGMSAGSGTTTANNSVYIGRAAGYQSNGEGNTFVGTETAPAPAAHTGSYNTLLGYQSFILNNPTNATAIGYGAAVTASNSVILGNSNVSVGIGVTAPVKKLTISSGVVNDGIRITQSGSGYAGVELFNTTSGGKIWSVLSLGNGNFQGPGNFLIYNGTHSRSDLLIEGGTGNTVLGGTNAFGYKLYVNGAAYATGGWFTSDRRFKKDIAEMHDALSTIQRLQGVRYSFIENIELPNARDEEGKPIMRNFPKGTQVGLIAQDVEKVLPEVVSTDNEGYKAIAYQNIVPLLIEGIKEQQGQIAQMSKKIEELQAAVASLEQCCPQTLKGKDIQGIQPSLEQNIPNPLNNSTLIRYNLGSATNALMQFTNMEGRTVHTQQLAQTGAGQLEVNTEAWPAGIYTYSLMVNGQPVDTKKMVIAR